MPLHVSSTGAHHQEVKFALHNLWYHHTYIRRTSYFYVRGLQYLLLLTQRSTERTSVARHSSQHNITQHDMLPQHPTCTTKLICDYF